jgi:putative flippase GtrA
LFLPAVASSVLGFILGAIVSYLLNYRITFTSSAPHLTTIPKFFFVASVGALVNTALMSALVHLIEFHYLPSQIISTVIVFFWSYLANRYWTFRKSIANR